MYDLNGKVALVTGAARKGGLGRCISLRLAQEGADVVVTDLAKASENLHPWEKEEGWRGLESLVEEIKSLGRRSLAVNADITNSDEVDNMVNKVVTEFSYIDILVNNAGLTSRVLGNNPVMEVSNTSWNLGFAVNLNAVFYLIRAVSKEMVKMNRGGKIVNIASLASKIAGPGLTSYVASKTGVLGLNQNAALDLAKYKINVNAICPGPIATLTDKTGQAVHDAVKTGVSEKEAINKAFADPKMPLPPWGRMAMREDIANVVAFLASEQSDYITGQAINVDGGRNMVH